jgi:hypothetical protein
MPDEAAGAPLVESGPGSPIPTPDQDLQPGGDADSGVLDRLEKLAGQNRRQKYYWALILVVLGVILATQAYVLFRPNSSGLAVEAFVVHDPNGNIRATLNAAGGKVRLDLWDPEGHRRATLGLGAEGAPHLAFYDRDQRVRAQLNLGPDGEPNFTLRDKRSLQGQTGPNAFIDAGHQKPSGGAVSGSEEGTVARSPASQAEAVAPTRDAEAEVEVVGTKTNKKYHYPTCKEVKKKKPWRLIKFKSAAEAQAHRYAPCPVCKPPPLSQ